MVTLIIYETWVTGPTRVTRVSPVEEEVLEPGYTLVALVICKTRITRLTGNTKLTRLFAHKVQAW